MFSSLDRADSVVADNTGRRRCLQTDHRSAAEIQRQEELSTLFALTRVLLPREIGAADEVLYVCSEPPPEFLRRAVASAGSKLQLHDGQALAYEGVLSQPEELADGAFRRLAQRVLHERNAGLEERTLVALEQAQAPDKKEDEQGYWTRVAELAALTGELLRAKFGGRWVAAPQMATLPFAFRMGTADSRRYMLANVVGNAERFLENGARDSLVELLRHAEEQASPSPGPWPVRVMLKAAEWPGRDTLACQPLAPWRDPRAALPWLTYGEELPHAFSHFSKKSLPVGALESLHARALENLKALTVKVLEDDQAAFRMLAVIGPFYAAEKVLDAGFMRGLHERLGSSSLMAGIPCRGSLFVMSARVKPTLLSAFASMCEAKYRRGESEPLCSTPLLIEDGKISGIVWAPPNRSARLVKASELNKEPSRGFLSRLLGWTRR